MKFKKLNTHAMIAIFLLSIGITAYVFLKDKFPKEDLSPLGVLFSFSFVAILYLIQGFSIKRKIAQEEVRRTSGEPAYVGYGETKFHS